MFGGWEYKGIGRYGIGIGRIARDPILVSGDTVPDLRGHPGFKPPGLTRTRLVLLGELAGIPPSFCRMWKICRSVPGVPGVLVPLIIHPTPPFIQPRKTIVPSQYSLVKFAKSTPKPAQNPEGLWGVGCIFRTGPDSAKPGKILHTGTISLTFYERVTGQDCTTRVPEYLPETIR